MIWIFSHWTEAEKNLCESCFIDDQRNDVIVLNDDGFLPAEVTSPYRYYVQEELWQQEAENPLFADLLEVPDLWEICMYYDKAEIWDEGIRKAEIEYAAPLSCHNVKNVRWMTQDGVVYKKDCYDRYGKLYYTDLIDREGHTDVRTYYAQMRPVLIYQPDFDTYTLLKNGKVYGMYGSRHTFLKEFLLQHFSEEKHILSNETEILEMVSEMGGPPCNSGNNVLILTNSDQVEHLEELICALPMLHYHIGAKTLMSDKLLRLRQYANVTLYQGISEQKRKELLIKSTYYLDINYYQEICNAVYEAFRYNLLIIGFDTTLHNKNCILQECVFKTEEGDQMIQFLGSMYADGEALECMVMRQNQLL